MYNLLFLPKRLHVLELCEEGGELLRSVISDVLDVEEDVEGRKFAIKTLYIHLFINESLQEEE